jgi:hypothetical protein
VTGLLWKIRDNVCHLVSDRRTSNRSSPTGKDSEQPLRHLILLFLINNILFGFRLVQSLFYFQIFGLLY